jgi:hypothetical protein
MNIHASFSMMLDINVEYTCTIISLKRAKNKIYTSLSILHYRTGKNNWDLERASLIPCCLATPLHQILEHLAGTQPHHHRNHR